MDDATLILILMFYFFWVAEAVADIYADSSHILSMVGKIAHPTLRLL